MQDEDREHGALPVSTEVDAAATIHDLQRSKNPELHNTPFWPPGSQLLVEAHVSGCVVRTGRQDTEALVDQYLDGDARALQADDQPFAARPTEAIGRRSDEPCRRDITVGHVLHGPGHEFECADPQLDDHDRTPHDTIGWIIEDEGVRGVRPRIGLEGGTTGSSEEIGDGPVIVGTGVADEKVLAGHVVLELSGSDEIHPSMIGDTTWPWLGHRHRLRRSGR